MTSSLTVGKADWAHVAYTYDNTSGDLKLYIDGQYDSSATIAHNDAFSFASTGYFYVGSGGPPGLLGSLDNVRVWSTARSAAQIAADMHKTEASGATGLQIQYSFDHYDGSTAVNGAATGSTLDGHAGGGATYFSPTDGDVTLHFNGSNTYLDTGITYLPAAFTLQASIRLIDGDSNPRPLFFKPTTGGGSGDMEFMLYVSGANQVVLRMGQGGSSYVDFIGASLSPGISYDVAAAYNPVTGDVGVYVNGQIYVNGGAAVGNFSAAGRQHGSNPIEIGRDSSYYFNGFVTNVRIWETYISPGQIPTQNISGVSYATGGLLADYPFFDGTGNFVSDASGNGHAAQIYGGNAWGPDGAPIVTVIPSPAGLSEDTGITAQIVATDPNSRTLTYSASVNPTHGSLSIIPAAFSATRPI